MIKLNYFFILELQDKNKDKFSKKKHLGWKIYTGIYFLFFVYALIFITILQHEDHMSNNKKSNLIMHNTKMYFNYYKYQISKNQ